MMQTMKRGLALIMVLVMFVAFVPALIVNVDAAGEVNYVYSGKYIYNWGTRGTVATFLSPNAEKFYEDNQTSYNELSSYSGGTGKSNAPNSALYRELQNLMKSNHDYTNGYSENNDLLKYTDCQNSGGKISSFYSGNAIGPNWGVGGWNKEHTWPDSKGLGGKDEDDIMMIRPTSTSENSSRGNTAYGQSSGYYNPNSESGGKYDLRGDVARIFLYVYVRWGNVNGNGSYDTWGTRGVMESVDVLLDWMEADPVDTWELGRNDSVESITGTRNVFVDYPEFAFLLFGEEIPTDMQTPSGGAQDCGHNNFGTGVVTAPTCTEKGFTTYTCKTAGCDYSYKSNFVAAKGHTFANGICSVCGANEPTAPAKPTYTTNPEVGKAYKLGLFSTEKNSEYYFTGTMSNYYGATDTAYANGVDVYVEQTNGGYHLYFKNASGAKQYISLVHVVKGSDEHYNFVFDSNPNSVFTWDTAKYTFKTTVNNQICYIGTYGKYVTMSVLRTDKLGDNDYYARLYVNGGTSSDTPTDTPSDTPCQHNYKETVIVPTCTQEGFTLYVCTICANSYKGNKTAAKGHNYTDDTCTVCGAAKPAPGTSTQATISFADSANRTELSTSKQVWKQNGITFTNEKANSQNDVANYVNPVRCYAGSNVTISYPGITKIVLDCSGVNANGKDYISGWLKVTGATATNNNGIVTVILNNPADSFTFNNLPSQSRAKSIIVYSETQADVPQACTHANTTVVGASEATCTKTGSTGTKICTQCNEVLSQNQTIPTTAHTYTNGTCSVCGAAESTTPSVPSCKHTNTITEGAVTATCTTDGHTGKTICADCRVIINNGKVIPATGHVYAAWVVVRKPSCTVDGLERRDCDHCSNYETRTISALGHNDADNNNICDVCEETLQQNEGTTPETPEAEEHVCKEVSGFKAFINSIINFFRKLFGQPERCPCGETIIEKKEQ